ncbi:MAG: RIP metalloprotease RseP [Rhodobacter sp.]|nr:RIP metalloprotease RseP [Rhodobacter sp.]
MLDLIPNFGNVLYTIGAFLVAFGVVAAVHEYGHYIVGRVCGIKAEVFSLGFGPEVWSREDRHGTRWRVACLPLGGYVRFEGDGNAPGTRGAREAAISGETGSRMAPGLRYTMDSAPIWARAATVAAGPIFNFALSVLIFASVIMIRGIAADPLVVDGLRSMPGPTAELLRGDQIIAVDGRDAPEVDGFGEFVSSLPPSPSLDYTVRRDGRVETVNAPHPLPSVIVGVAPGSAAADAGLLRNDVVLSVNGEDIWTFDQLREAVEASGGDSVTLELWRDGTTREVSLLPRRTDLPLPDGAFETRYLIGVTGGLLFEPGTRTPGLGRAIGHGLGETLDVIRLSLSGVYHIAAGLISSCNLRGPIGIAETSGAAASQGWVSFIQFIAVLSAAIGLINLFPIPVLDGGHLVFHAWEALTGKRPNDRVQRVLTGIGLTLILALMAFALLNDIRCP